MRVRKIEILYEDAHLFVCRKPAGVATQSAKAGQQDMVSLIKNDRAKKGEEPYVGLIHRLDQPVEGVMVFAKTKQAAAALSKQVADRGMDKFYLAVVEGRLEKTEEILEHYLIRDGKTNLSRVVSEPKELNAKDSQAKLARLSYQVLSYQEDSDTSLVRIKLDTGRHHQIRVQMAAIGHPLCGDQKYNPSCDLDGNNRNRQQTVALCSYKIGFVHPTTKKDMTYEILPQNPLFDGFRKILGVDN